MTNMEEGALNTMEAPPAFAHNVVSEPPADVDASALQDGEPGGESLNGGEAGEERGPIPYERFKQVNDELQGVRQWEPILKLVQESGFESPDAFLQAIQQRNQETQTREKLDPIAQDLTAQVDSGALDWDTAERLWAAERDKVLANEDRAMYHNWQQHQELQQAREKFPEMDETYVIEMAHATKKPILQLAELSHSQRAKYRDEAIARYNAAKGLAPAAPEGSGGPPPVPKGAPNPNKDPQGFIAWMDAQAAQTQAKYGR